MSIELRTQTVIIIKLKRGRVAKFSFFGCFSFSPAQKVIADMMNEKGNKSASFLKLSSALTSFRLEFKDAQRDYFYEPIYSQENRLLSL